MLGFKSQIWLIGVYFVTVVVGAFNDFDYLGGYEETANDSNSKERRWNSETNVTEFSDFRATDNTRTAPTWDWWRPSSTNYFRATDNTRTAPTWDWWRPSSTNDFRPTAQPRTGPTWDRRRPTSTNDFRPTGYPRTGPTWDWRRSTSTNDFRPTAQPTTGPTWDRWRPTSTNDFRTTEYPRTGPTWDWRRPTSTNDFRPTRYPKTGPTGDWWRPTSTNDFRPTGYPRTGPTRDWWRPSSTNDFRPTGYPRTGPTWDWWRSTSTNDFRSTRNPRTGATWDWRRHTSTNDFKKTDYWRPTTWRPATPKVCDCGDQSLMCEYFNSEKKCTCVPGYAQIGGTCSDCYCGENAHDCHFDSRGNKVCTCFEGYAQRNRTCSETCSKQSDCLNGGVCARGEKRAHFCECNHNFGGGRCEVNVICKRLKASCDSIGAVCRLANRIGICECPPHKVFKPETGQCEDICTSQTCLHGICEIMGKDSNCICDAGFSGTHCDQRVIIIKGYEVPLIVTSVFLVITLFFVTVTVYFLYKRKMLNSVKLTQMN